VKLIAIVLAQKLEDGTLINIAINPTLAEDSDKVLEMIRKAADGSLKELLSAKGESN
jgi:hypothetical protein